jgi:hypothetical protein
VGRTVWWLSLYGTAADKDKIARKPEPERPAVKATGAGAKFLADLADDDNGGLF